MSRYEEFLQGINGINQYLSIPQFVYSVNISPRFGYVYVETPKACCSTIKKLLIQAELDTVITYRDVEYIHLRDWSPLLNPKQVGVFYKFMERKLFKFCFVRDPYARLLSAYLDKIKRNKEQKSQILLQLGYPLHSKPEISFKEFVKQVAMQPISQMNPHWRIQYYQTMQDTIKYDFVGKCENADEDLKYVCTKVGIQYHKFMSSELRHATGANTKLNEYYDDETKQIVYEKFFIDFEHFGYNK